MNILNEYIHLTKLSLLFCFCLELRIKDWGLRIEECGLKTNDPFEKEVPQAEKRGPNAILGMTK